MKNLVFAVLLFFTATATVSAQCACGNQVKNDSVAVVTPPATVVETPATPAAQTVVIAPPKEKYESVVLIVKKAGATDEVCTFVYEGKYYIGKNLAYELAKCYRVGYHVAAVANDPTSQTVHYILERRVE